MLAKSAHKLFLRNLVVNHVFLFSALATLGSDRVYWLVVVPIFSALAIIYTFYRASQIDRDDSEFAFIHWQITLRWARLLALMLALLIGVSVVSWYGYHNLGLARELSYALVGGVGVLPLLVSVLILIGIESASLRHAREGTLPDWAQRRFLGESR